MSEFFKRNKGKAKDSWGLILILSTILSLIYSVTAFIFLKFNF